MRYAVERGHLTIGMGDFNIRPLSLAHQIIERHSHTRDSWRIIHPDSSLGSTTDPKERARKVPLPNATYNITENGTTCDSILNTWRWNKAERKKLKSGQDIKKSATDIDPKAKRLDYIFVGQDITKQWRLASTSVGMMERHPTLRCSLSDHFSAEATLIRQVPEATNAEATTEPSWQITALPARLPESVYCDIQAITETYSRREKRQRKLRLSHGIGQLLISVGCSVGVWWSPTNYVSFILLLTSTFGLAAGLIDALIGGLFVGSELRLLQEFEWEIAAARRLAHEVNREEETTSPKTNGSNII